MSKNKKIKNEKSKRKLKNLGKRSVRVPYRVKRGVPVRKTNTKQQTKCNIIHIM